MDTSSHHEHQSPRPLTANDIDALTALTDLALPGERLTADELLTLCFEDPDPACVLAVADHEDPSSLAGAVAVVVRRPDPDRSPVAHLQLLVVAPVQQGSGLGGALLTAAEEWARREGRAGAIVAGAAAPFYLWPGVDVRWTRALVMFEAAGYRLDGATMNMSCPTTFRIPPPEGIRVGRVLDDEDADAARVLCDAHWPQWSAELRRAIDHGACFLAQDTEEDGSAVGFACHSVNRVGWIGPMATAPHARHRHIGAALLSALCTDLRAAGLPDAEISWVGPVGFYARSAGASVSRVFRPATKRLGEAR